MYRTICLLLCLCFIITDNPKGQEAVKELSLKGAVETALKNNPGVKKALHGVEAAKGRYYSGISLPSPQLSLTYEEIPLKNRFRNAGEKYLEISQSFDFPVSMVLKRRSLSEQIDIASLSVEAEIISLTSTVRRAYFSVLAAEKKLRLAGESLKISEDFAQKALVRLKAGEAGPLEEMTARVQKARSSSTLEIRKNELLSAVNELNLAMGISSENPLGNSSEHYKLIDTLGYIKLEQSGEELLNSALLSNPLIRSASLNRSSASLEHSIQWWNLFPSFELSYSRQSIDGNDSYYGFSLGISLPLWFMFRERGQIKEASAGLSIAEAEERSTRNEITSRLSARYLNYRNSRERIDLYINSIIPQAEEIFRTARLSYETGEATYLEFLQASQTLVSAKEEYIDALLDYNLSLADLSEVTGKTF